MIGEIIAAVIPLFPVIGVAAIGVFLSRIASGLWLNPFTVFVSSWLPMLLVNISGWVTFNPLDNGFLLLAGSSIVAFFLGCISGSSKSLFSSDLSTFPKPANTMTVHPLRFLRLLHITGVIALTGFLGFTAAAIWQIGWRGLLLNPGVLRTAMALDTFVDPLKMLNYANLVFPVLVVIGHVTQGGLSRRWWLLAAFSAATNVLSTGRTKVFWVGLWMLFTFLISRHRLSTRRIILFPIIIGIILMITFSGMAVWIGKVFSPQEISLYASESPEIFTPTISYFYYLGTNLPYLQEVVAEGMTTELPLGNSLLPFYKTLALLPFDPPLPVPSEILEFKPLPRIANTGTWLVQWYRDFGLSGLVLMPFLVGLVISRFISRDYLPANDPLRLYLGGLLLYFVWAGFQGNKFISTPTWIFVLLGCPAMIWIRIRPSEGTLINTSIILH
ncbi:MAG: oligosaccharide repeat unit polymerase [Candidatus Riflebacteria bacterium]|nr:oligosaccharide repeat unit polymerase [Candidatus Riflebacteria bacterium]